MTVIRHNSISGIVSITAAAGSNLSFYDSTGSNLRLDTGDINAGVITATTANFTNATVTGDLTVQGTTTTLDTTVTEVDKLEVGANNTTVGVAITQSGSGDILRLYDGATQVVTVKDGGNLGLNNTNPQSQIHITNASTSTVSLMEDGSSGADLVYDGSTNYFSIKTGTGGPGSQTTRLTIQRDNGNIGIGTDNPASLLHLSDTSGALIINRETDSLNQITFRTLNTTRGSIGADSSACFTVYDSVAAEKLRISSGGEVRIGTNQNDITGAMLQVMSDRSSRLRLGNNRATESINQLLGEIEFYSNDSSGPGTGVRGSISQYTANADGSGSYMTFSTGDASANDTERLRILSDGATIIGDGTAWTKYVSDTVLQVTHDTNPKFVLNNPGNRSYSFGVSTDEGLAIRDESNTAERLRIHSNGYIGINQSSPYADLDITSSTEETTNTLAAHGIRLAAIGAGNEEVIPITACFVSAQARSRAGIGFISKQASSADGYAGAIGFYTRSSADGNGLYRSDERMRIDEGGSVLVGTTNGSAELIVTGSGINLKGDGRIATTAQSNTTLYANRAGTDGTVIQIRHQGTQEGTISVSGTTVSYNGGHLARWSQLPGNAERTEILRGSVLSNIDEMCEWGEEGNEQLNRMKVSDVEGDKNVSGVFQAWDDDDDTYTNDFYCAMTGDFVIRIAQGVTVERGDLLMSAGDGTAKPQEDDIIRSKTIAKVTSTNVSCTYNDGSYCVPCVLMAC